MSTVRADEGRRVFRNVASFGAFVITPLQMLMLSRALGPSGYGHWWWTFGVLEAATILGSFGSDLFIRREMPRIAREKSADELPAVVGSGLAVVGVLGVVLALLQLGLASPLASAQKDPELLPFLLLLACQPVLWNLTGILVAALQSINVLGPVAAIRGIVTPVVQVGLLYIAWRCELSTTSTLLLLVAVSVLAFLMITGVYARHFSVLRTLKEAIRPRYARQAMKWGFAMLAPSLLFTAGGKLDLYVLGAYQISSMVGVYAACLAIAAMLPATRALFDPVVLTQIGALHGVENHELRASLARMTRMCLIAMTPPLVILIAIGQPLLHGLLGRPVPFAITPLAILCVGQLVGSLAIAGLLIPMMMAGRVLALIAGVTLAIKFGLLLLLVPRYGLVGAAIATAAGTIVAQQGQVIFAAQRLGYRPYAASLLPPLFVTSMIAVGGRVLFVGLDGYLSELPAAAIAGAASLAVLAGALGLVLDSSERAAFRRLFRLAPRGR
ncbi:MAG: polysaccharide biosynthesis protein [Myxococcales bacterium]|nr:polysaccharide biosynthesis protein [Myxococcales bacterium]